MKLLKEPLLQFLALGAGLFLLYGLVDDSGGHSPDTIVVTAGQTERLAEGFRRTWQRPPTREELDGLVEEHIKEEVYYREALAMGLDRDDTIVRRRLRQKLEFLADDIGDAIDPTDAELASYLEAHPDDFRIAAHVSFDQVYLSRDRRGPAAERDAANLLARLQASAVTPGELASLGDGFLLPLSYERVSEDEILSRFGNEFTAGLVELPVGGWAGPVESGFGLHLVRINERLASVSPALNDIRQLVEREWRNARRRETSEAFYQSLRGRYAIEIESPTATGEDSGAEVAEVRR